MVLISNKVAIMNSASPLEESNDGSSGLLLLISTAGPSICLIPAALANDNYSFGKQ